MSYPNRDALRAAHDIYLNAMRPFVINHTLEEINGEIDISDIARIITNNWFNSFKQWFENVDPYYEARSAAWQIVESRNRASHPPWDLDPEFTRAHLFLIANLLEKINRSDAKREVENIRDQLCSDEVEEHPAEVENAEPPTTVTQRFSPETSVDEIRKISDMMVELRIADDGSRPLSWKNCRAELNLRNDEFHKVIRLSPQYRAAVIARINKLRAREEGWEYRGKLEVLTGIEISEEELA